jgi:hypothetical protein
MGINLSETAAEIIKASIGKNQEPTKKLPGEVNDLGGATPQDDYSGPGAHGEKDVDAGVGKKAAASVAVAPKPTPKGDAKSAKVPSVPAVAEEVSEEGINLEDLSEEELDEFLASLSEEEMDELEASLEISDEDAINELSEEELDEILASLSEEEMAALEEEMAELEEAKSKKWNKKAMPTAEAIDVKELVKANMVSMQEDVDALFNGESLSEDFRKKAATIFEAAAAARVEAIVEKIVAKNNAYLSEASDALRDNLAEQVDSYLNYVVEEWMTANQVAVESGLRGEIAEGFIKGLKGLFAEHYIEVPEDKIDLVDELATTVDTLENDLAEEIAAKAVLQKSLNESKSQEVLRKICEGLTEVQIQKIKTLAEGVEFTTAGEYTEKLTVIRENYFPTKNAKSEAPTTIVETADASAENIAPRMDLYVKAITKTLPV